MTFKKRLLRLLVAFALGYGILFALCLGYSYLAERPDQSGYSAAGPAEIFSREGKKNYASAPMKSGGAPQVDAASIRADQSQKYEQRGDVTTNTPAFDQDEKKAREAVLAHSGIVQLERSTGTKGRRQLLLSVGVTPAGFDSLFKAMQGIGKVTGSTVTKVDKTNEYLALRAKKISLEKNLKGLAELRSLKGEVADFIQLQNRILETEEALQKLGVSMGEFDEINSFCTVNLSLAESVERVAVKRSFLSHAKGAVQTSVLVYAGLLFFTFCAAVTAFFVLLVVDKAKLLQRLWEKLEGKSDS